LARRRRRPDGRALLAASTGLSASTGLWSLT
jgi:hypothetical protein